jgi:hypothetical protein
MSPLIKWWQKLKMLMLHNLLIGSPSKGVMTRSQKLASFVEHHSFVSCIEPKNVEEALQDPDWVNAMHKEFNNFTRNKV